MEKPDLERTMEQVLPYGKSIAWKQDKLFKLVLVSECWLSNLSDISLEWVVHFGRNMSDLRVWSLNHLECTVFSLPEPTWIVCLVFRQYSFHKEGLAPAFPYDIPWWQPPVDKHHRVIFLTFATCHAIQTLYIYSNVKLMQLSLSLAWNHLKIYIINTQITFNMKPARPWMLAHLKMIWQYGIFGLKRFSNWRYAWCFMFSIQMTCYASML
jgi:hypothetical protein